MMAEDRSSTSAKYLTGLIGAPIAQSAAPAMHEQAADALGVRCHYQLIEVANADAATLRALLDGVRRLGFAGVNVTFPYKEAVIPLLDEMSPDARIIGAVNTVVVRDGRLFGHNTDSTGFARAIGDLIDGSKSAAVALIGAGGVGKAIAFALARLGVAELNIFDADRSKAEELSSQLHGRLTARVADDVASALHGVAGSGQRNAGRHAAGPRLWRCRRRCCIAACGWQTRSTRRYGRRCCSPRAKGASVMTGRDLAIYQAADAFELFTGLKPSVAAIGNAFDGVAQRQPMSCGMTMSPRRRLYWIEFDRTTEPWRH